MSYTSGKLVGYMCPDDPAFPSQRPRKSHNSDLSSIWPLTVVRHLSDADLHHRKGVSFLSRIMGGKKRDETSEIRDNVSEISDHRSAGTDAEVFSQPVGFIPRFPAPPKYIRVKAQNTKRKDFDRVFLAQMLLGTQSRSRKSSIDMKIDSKIMSIDETPTAPAVQSSKASANKSVWAMEFSKDGKYLAAAGQDKKLRVWEIVSSAEEREAEEKQSSSDSGGEDDTKLNAPIFKQKLVREYDGHTSSILDLSWSKNNFLLSSSMDKTVRLYHVSRAECLCAFKHNDFVTSIQFHPRDDRFFLAGSLDAKLRLWSIPDKNVAYWAQVPDMVTAVAFTPDGKTAIAGCLNGLCILYDTEGLKAHSQINVRSARGRNAKGSKITGIDTIALPRGNAPPVVKLLITSNDSRIRMYNLKDRNLETKFRGNENSCSQIHATFSDDGKYVICGSEDRRVYVWPTGPSQKPESDKRPVEVFEASSAIVTTALLAPSKTRRLLGQSGDPIYDLCNPPPVTLLSRADSAVSSGAPVSSNGEKADMKHNNSSPHNSEFPKRAPQTPAYLDRHNHPGGQIIVTADYTGHIKVFRQDCAFQKRRAESWDARSTFSKSLCRSGSVTTRGSASSSQKRSSVPTLTNSKNPSSDRILNWRDGISVDGTTSNSTSTSALNSHSNVNLSIDTNGLKRDTTPKKSLAQRFSLKRSSPASPSSPEAHTNGHSDRPSITVQSPMSTDSPRYHSAPEDTSPMSTPPSDLTKQNPLVKTEDNPLMLMGSQSLMAWDVKNTLVPMANAAPRTPELPGAERNPMGRANSYVSQLSSEMTSSETDGEEVEADMKCRECGNENFKMNGKMVKCKRCGVVV